MINLNRFIKCFDLDHFYCSVFPANNVDVRLCPLSIEQPIGIEGVSIRFGWVKRFSHLCHLFGLFPLVRHSSLRFCIFSTAEQYPNTLRLLHFLSPHSYRTKSFNTFLRISVAHIHINYYKASRRNLGRVGFFVFPWHVTLDRADAFYGR